jgi:hypothetical protein
MLPYDVAAVSYPGDVDCHTLSSDVDCAYPSMAKYKGLSYQRRVWSASAYLSVGCWTSDELLFELNMIVMIVMWLGSFCRSLVQMDKVARAFHLVSAVCLLCFPFLRPRQVVK